MSDDTSYNGWRNYPTWCVNLWLSNDEGLYREALEIVACAITGADESQQEPENWQRISRRLAVADALKAWVSDFAEFDHVAGTLPIVSDLLGWALDHVDWLEIADAWILSAQELEVS